MGSTVNGHYTVLRNSCRFPLHLEVIFKTATEEFHAETIDISADGFLFQTEADIQVDAPVEFTIVIPREALGTERRVLVKCRGRGCVRTACCGGHRLLRVRATRSRPTGPRFSGRVATAVIT